MKRVYTRIEQQALEVYGSNEPWALKAWAYSNILKDVIADENNDGMVSQLIQPIEEWQDTQFDPLLNFKRKLEGGEYSINTIRGYMKIAGEFCAKYSKKQRYGEPEILDYIDHLKKKYSKNSFATCIHQLKAFLDSLPVDKYGLKQLFPLKRMPKHTSEFYEPTFTVEELEALGAAALLDEKPHIILRLLIAQLYAPRLGELETLSSKDINLDKDNPTITFMVQKRRTAKGVPVMQPIPKSLLPYFAIKLESLHRSSKYFSVYGSTMLSARNIQRPTNSVNNSLI